MKTTVGLLGALIGLFILFFLFIYMPVYGIHFQTSSGEHTGYVTAVEKTGIFFKTGVAHIKSDVSSSQEDAYCVEDDTVYNKLADLSRDKSRVTVKFIDYLIKGAKDCNGEQAIIVGVVSDYQRI